LDLTTEYSAKVEDELKNKVLVLNSIIQSLDKLSEELVLNISQVESESENELNDLFDEFSRVTGSVRAYE
jgi:transcriptional accessory protein Tex/SPT6